MRKPLPTEHDPYFQLYLDRVEGADLLGQLDAVNSDTQALLARLSEEQGAHRYAEGKWSIKEILGHLVDGERIFAARALAFARDDATALPGFDHEAYVRSSGADSRALSDLAAEFAAVRRATITLFRTFDEPTLDQEGVANESRVSVRAIGFVIVGHELHHRSVIQERYL